MVNELVEASHQGRSPFLKSESFRLLAQLFIAKKENNEEKNKESEEVNTALKKACAPFCDSLEKAFSGSELTKAKRLRDILKASEKLVEFTNSHGDESTWNAVGALSGSLTNLHSTSASNSVKSICDKLEKSIREGLEKVAKEKTEVEAASEETATTATPSKNTAGSKAKAKKSKKKKKKGKK